MPNTQASPTSVYLDRELRLWLDLTAQADGRSRSKLVNRALSRYRLMREKRRQAQRIEGRR